ncbi:MAG: 16S rRNA (adenine(1518)-N(6)/adenine(1519)-N(6))-dimethyltransferase RsmA [Bacillota bacterium]|nr:16S rRNA (adenine(1518)-N(6)/adenine(1519)-N(6))-dimethyltransferase RsmA [Bacillota bacterium]
MDNYTTKDIVKKYGFKFSKSLGQNFLIDDTVLTDIVNGSEVNEEDIVIEIGPGVGTLTKELLRKSKKVYAIELDDDLIPILQKELKDFQNFELIHNDALKVDFNEIIGYEASVKVVANLPYYVTTPIIAKLLKENYRFKSITIMIQKEVAERFLAKCSTKEYGSITLLIQYYCNIIPIRKVSQSSFIPQPKVESMVIKMDRLSAPRVIVKNEELFFKIIRESFNFRRKTLWNALKNLKINADMLKAAFIKSGIDDRRRGETLSIEEFAVLSDCIDELLR